MNEEFEGIIPPEMMSDSDFKKAKEELDEVRSRLDNLADYCRDLGEYECSLEFCEDSDEEEYLKAKIKIAEYDVKNLKKEILSLFEEKFPGFAMKKISEVMLAGVKEVSGVNEELLCSECTDELFESPGEVQGQPRKDND